MIKVKITPMGGYVCGDGNIPSGLDPDTFMKMFGARIMRAQAEGLTELGFEDIEVTEMLNQAISKWDALIDDTPAREYRDNFNAVQLLEQI